jgi:hypothetical protein
VSDDERLLAVSDLLVLVALERGFARVVPRSLRPRVPSSERHRGYTLVRIQPEAINKALTDAWVLCPMLASRNRFTLEVPAWQELLDSYTRSLLLSAEPHTPSLLRPHLQALNAAVAEPARNLRAIR